MRLIVVQWSHGETTTDRQRAGGQGAARCKPCHRFGPTARGPSGATAGRSIGYAGANRGHLGGRAGDRATIAAALPPVSAAAGDPAPLGRAAQGAAQCGRRSGVLGTMGRAGQRGPPLGALAHPRRTGATIRTARGRLGGLAPAGSARMAQGGPGHAHPKSDPLAQEAWKKNSPKYWRPS